MLFVIADLIYLKRVWYTTIVSALTVIFMGPWIGFNILSLLSANFEVAVGPYAEITLCSILYLISVTVLISPDKLIVLVTWSSIYLILVIGHWAIYFQNTFFSDHPDSMSERRGPYLIFTLAWYVPMVLLGVNYIIIRRLCFHCRRADLEEQVLSLPNSDNTSCFLPVSQKEDSIV